MPLMVAKPTGDRKARSICDQFRSRRASLICSGVIVTLGLLQPHAGAAFIAEQLNAVRLKRSPDFRREKRSNDFAASRTLDQPSSCLIAIKSARVTKRGYARQCVVGDQSPRAEIRVSKSF